MLNYFDKGIKKCFLYPTQLCNLNCIMCYSGSHQNKIMLEREMSYTDYTKIIDVLYSYGVRTFDISGGEPLMRNDMCDIIKYIKKYNDTTVLLVTNGTLIHKMYSQLSGLNYIDRIYISMDSHNSEVHNKIRNSHNAFQDSLKGINALISNGYTNMGINFVVQKKNFIQIDEFLDFAVEIGARYIHLLRLIDVKKGNTESESLQRKDYEQLIQKIISWTNNQTKDIELVFVLPGYFWAQSNQFRKQINRNNRVNITFEYDPLRGCSAFTKNIAITTTGNVTGCTAMVNYEEFHVGNIKDDEYSKLRKKWINMRNLLDLRETKVHENETCQLCTDWNCCRGGCPVISYKNNCTFMLPDLSCD